MIARWTLRCAGYTVYIPDHLKFWPQVRTADHKTHMWRTMNAVHGPMPVGGEDYNEKLKRETALPLSALPDDLAVVFAAHLE